MDQAAPVDDRQLRAPAAQRAREHSRQDSAGPDPPRQGRGRRPGGRRRGRRPPYLKGGRPDWWPDWEGQAAVVVAGGPSARDARLDRVRGRARCLVVNDGWRLAGWADVLYACDLAWWERWGGVPGFGGLKLSADRSATRRSWGVRHVRANREGDRLGLVERGSVGWAGNSGFQALNLAIQFGARRIALVGFDMTLAHGLHWHGAHPKGLNNPSAANVDRWRRCTDAAAETIAALGVDVVNCSPISALQNYRKGELEEIVTC